jgi:protein FAM32A
LKLAARKKKKTKTTNVAEPDRELDPVKASLLEEDTRKAESPEGSGRNSPSVSGGNPKKTEAERRFEEVQKRRVRNADLQNFLLLTSTQLAARVAKLAHKTHKDRVGEFNAKLEALSEHHDIPKVCCLNQSFVSSV